MLFLQCTDEHCEMRLKRQPPLIKIITEQMYFRICLIMTLTRTPDKLSSLPSWKKGFNRPQVDVNHPKSVYTLLLSPIVMTRVRRTRCRRTCTTQGRFIFSRKAVQRLVWYIGNQSAWQTKTQKAKQSQGKGKKKTQKNSKTLLGEYTRKNPGTLVTKGKDKLAERAGSTQTQTIHKGGGDNWTQV